MVLYWYAKYPCGGYSLRWGKRCSPHREHAQLMPKPQRQEAFSFRIHIHLHQILAKLKQAHSYLQHSFGLYRHTPFGPFLKSQEKNGLELLLDHFAIE